MTPNQTPTDLTEAYALARDAYDDALIKARAADGAYDEACADAEDAEDAARLKLRAAVDAHAALDAADAALQDAHEVLGRYQRINTPDKGEGE